MTAAKIAQEADTMKKREHTRSGNLSGCFLASEELIIMVFAWGGISTEFYREKNILPDSGNILNNGTIGSYVVYEPLAIILTAELNASFFLRSRVPHRENIKQLIPKGKLCCLLKILTIERMTIGYD